jgi:ABC-2 type transport system ATP-binding protein
MTGPQRPAVEVVDLVKRYSKSDTNAIDGLTFNVARGEIFGLLGPNGAGKSTTIGVLTTRIRATGGRARVGGVDVRADPVGARSRLAVVPQHNNIDRSLTPRQNLVFHAAYHGVGRADRVSRAQALLDRFGLAAFADATKVDWYSGGMAQRLMLARSLMHEPEVLFLDEPTNALDPQARMLIREQIRDLRARGVTIVLTTHQLNEATALLDRVGIVDRGSLIALDTPGNLIRGLAGRAVLDLTLVPAAGEDRDGLLRAMSDLPGVRKAERLGPATLAGSATGPRPAVAGTLPAARRTPAGGAVSAMTATLAPRRGTGPAGALRVRLYLAADPAATLGPALSLLAVRSATLIDVHIAEPTLEDVFIELTGREPR